MSLGSSCRSTIGEILPPIIKFSQAARLLQRVIGKTTPEYGTYLQEDRLLRQKAPGRSSRSMRDEMRLFALNAKRGNYR
ncbi:hypothetical protein [Antarcticirhabdus aurantiaca]|uniref:Uncharacterized protein n=1 Tax=Antarcticirhabdus aurantiaca TaxID=2606717 RepID=A0ACD4NT71_9HYPH|nr:hypothetical protein [Antarcticirhabdus aurantiaca]WAJ30002.1 hypothetical protein OXU80_07265 [Jeongeuplla avenae]